VSPAFWPLLEQLTTDAKRRLAEANPEQVRKALTRRLTPADAPLLVSEAAGQFIEVMAHLARRLTILRFGRVITLYAPLYLSNYCQNQCLYCGFSARRPIERIALGLEQVEQEADIILSQGIRHLLLVTGEAPEKYGLDRIVEAARRLRPRVASLSVEIFPCSLTDYRRLVSAGVDGLVLYQETYQPQVYARLHPAGPKSDFAARLAAIEAGGEAGMRSLGVGALLGLAPPRLDACLLIQHAAWLERRFPRSRLAISFPRLRPVPGGIEAEHPVDDKLLVQFILAARLLLPDAEIVVSTREPAALRDRLLGLGVTRISAGSRTSPGGYSGKAMDDHAGQFFTEDRRSVSEVIQAVRAAGLDVALKDFDAAFCGEKST